jgi:hypothetical protein
VSVWSACKVQVLSALSASVTPGPDAVIVKPGMSAGNGLVIDSDAIVQLPVGHDVGVPPPPGTGIQRQPATATTRIATNATRDPARRTRLMMTPKLILDADDKTHMPLGLYEARARRART